MATSAAATSEASTRNAAPLVTIIGRHGSAIACARQALRIGGRRGRDRGGFRATGSRQQLKQE
jgi:hypothetical protein